MGHFGDIDLTDAWNGHNLLAGVTELGGLVPRLLHIQSSPNVGSSVTRVLSDKFVATWTASHANVEVDRLDLVAEPLPHQGPDWLEGLVCRPDERTPKMVAALAISDRLINQLEAADIIVIGAPMINFTLCTQLKSWVDYVTVAGRTFEYFAPGQARGRLFGKKVFVIAARGGDYSEPPMNAFDFQEPLLRLLLGFLGLYDVSFIRAEGMRQRVDQVDVITRYAESVIARLAA
jgi:FMN-dependent NADH-azoreductase